MMKQAVACALLFGLGCGSSVTIEAISEPAEDPELPPPHEPDDPPEQPPEDPPEQPPVEMRCDAGTVSVEVAQISGSDACDYGSVSNINPGVLLSVEPAPEREGVRVVMQGCPNGADCICEITVACVGSDVADVFAGVSAGAEAAIWPDALRIGLPGAWECLDFCVFVPPYFYAADVASLAPAMGDETLTVALGQLTATSAIANSTFETHALDVFAQNVGWQTDNQTIGGVSVDEGETQLIEGGGIGKDLFVRNLRSTSCTSGCTADQPPAGSAAFVVFGSPF